MARCGKYQIVAKWANGDSDTVGTPIGVASSLLLCFYLEFSAPLVLTSALDLMGYVRWVMLEYDNDIHDAISNQINHLAVPVMSTFIDPFHNVSALAEVYTLKLGSKRLNSVDLAAG